ncbi:hypothetical protein [Clostridium felsineum]|uniref:hypothetical protein n=1 Tax=Clostridium felsineum TaxID=36839 RepID=UPI00098BFA70|nr:hypothetical protein [Clostridium felsineum]URZ15422.1 hypothetical protein CLFE_014620 [Clostridium felsineum DSM 794]
MNRKLKFIIIISIITALFMGLGVFLFLKFVYVDNHTINPKKDIQTKVKSAKSNIEDGKEKRVNIEIKRESKKNDKLKKFESKDDNNVNVGANTSNERKSNGSFYVDNINDLYDDKLVSLDEMFLIEKRLKEAVEDMPKLHRETLNIKNNGKALSKYILKNKDRIDYLYGIDDVNSLRALINKLSVGGDNSKSRYGVIDNLNKQDDNNLRFILNVHLNENKCQAFNINLEFKHNRAILNIKIM